MNVNVDATEVTLSCATKILQVTAVFEIGRSFVALYPQPLFYGDCW